MKTKIKILIGISIILITLIPVVTKADGGVTFSVDIETPEEEINIPSQKAVIIWDGENEILSLSTGMKASELTDLAWIVPISSKGKPEVGEENG